MLTAMTARIASKAATVIQPFTGQSGVRRSGGIPRGPQQNAQP